MEHAELVRALVKPGAEVLATLTPARADLWHGVTGVVGEAAEILFGLMEEPEVDRENMVEELGDMEFYLEQMRQNLGIDRPEPVADRAADQTCRATMIESASVLCVAAGLLLDTVKKHVIYNKDIDTFAVYDALSDIEAELHTLRWQIGATHKEVLDGNIAKLTIRYGSVYSDAAAQARADKEPGK